MATACHILEERGFSKIHGRPCLWATEARATEAAIVSLPILILPWSFSFKSGMPIGYCRLRIGYVRSRATAQLEQGGASMSPTQRPQI
eukprot:11716351-Heterocapsa_arctica.AAC.1